LLVVAAHRTVELGRTHPLTAVLAEWRREGVGERLSLGALTAPDVGVLIRALSRVEPAEAVTAAIHRETEGNPFFAGELVRHLVAEGHDLSERGVLPRRWSIPESVREVIGYRLARLSVAARTTIEVAAVLSEDTGFDVLRAAGDIEEAALLTALEELQSAGILCEEGDGYHFTHALIQQTVYENLNLPRKQRLHRRAVDALTELHRQNLGPHIAALAVHSRLAGSAGDVEQAIEYSIAAGEAARAVFAWEEATTHWQAALAMVEEHGSEPERRAYLLERLGDLMYVSALDRIKGIDYLERALALYEALGQEDRAAQMHSRLGVHLVNLNPSLSEPQRALAHFRAAEAVLSRGRERVPLGFLYTGLAQAAVLAVRTDEGLAAAGRAMAIGERLRHDGLWITGAYIYSFHLFYAGRLAEAWTLLEQAWEKADRLNHPVAAYWLSTSPAQWSRYQLDPRDTQRWLERELAKPRSAQNTAYRSVLINWLSWYRGIAGDVTEARALLPETERDLPFWDGAWEQAATGLVRRREQFQQRGNTRELCVILHQMAQLYRVRDEVALAEPVLEELLAIGIDGPHLPAELRARADLALCYAETGRLDDARAHLERCAAILAEGEAWRGLTGYVLLAQAVFAAAEGRLADSDRRFAQAAGIFQRFCLPWDEAELLLCWSGVLSKAGLHAAAAEKLEAARDTYRRIGAGQRWLARTSVDVDTSPRPAYPNGLSQREVEVLRLLAAGKSNPEIAAMLVLSRNTVYRHVSNVFDKIGVANRVEAAAYAHRHRLVE
jgi:ATP/maltotriose-dependent transcriptional regulator MalT